jgi:hypothetical protein
MAHIQLDCIVWGTCGSLDKIDYTKEVSMTVSAAIRVYFEYQSMNSKKKDR